MKYNQSKCNKKNLSPSQQFPINTKSNLNEGCCSVILQVAHNHNVVAFRRDSKFPAEIMITHKSFHGTNAVVQYKITGGLFDHTVITSDGWIIGCGGLGTTHNQELMSLASQIIKNGKITPEDMQKAQSILIQMLVGHFLIKSPDNTVGCVISFQESVLNKLYKMDDGEFISVPNAPQYYRNGKYTEFDNDPLIAAAEIVGTDLWGVNRRDVIFNNIKKSKNNTHLQVWASYDNGSLIDCNHGEGGPDDIQFLRNKRINGENLPVIPKMSSIGEISLE